MWGSGTEVTTAEPWKFSKMATDTIMMDQFPALTVPSQPLHTYPKSPTTVPIEFLTQPLPRISFIHHSQPIWDQHTLWQLSKSKTWEDMETFKIIKIIFFKIFIIYCHCKNNIVLTEIQCKLVKITNIVKMNEASSKSKEANPLWTPSCLVVHKMVPVSISL